MKDAVLVGVVNSVGDFGNKFDDFLGFTAWICSRLFRSGGSPGLVLAGRSEAIGQTAAWNELHREIRTPFMFSNIVDWNDVRVLQSRHRLGFGAKPFHIGLARETRCQ